MKLQPDRIDTLSVTGYGPGWVAIQGEKVTRSVVITSEGQRFDWNCSNFESLSAAHFEQLAQLQVELIVFGSGNRLRFVSPTWMASLIQKQTGVETMDTQAACRTYNILAGEGRQVAAALLIEPPGEPGGAQ